MAGNLYDLLASCFPDDRGAACFIVPGAATISYGDLESGAAQAGALLIAKGVAPGDRVAMQAEKSAAAVMIYLGCLRAGAVFVPLNTAYTQTEIDYFLKDAEPKLFLRDAEEFMREAAKVAPLATTIARGADDLASLIYTSGTTGRSKGAMLSHGNLAANALTLHSAWGFSRDDVLLHALPIFHVRCAALRVPERRADRVAEQIH